MMLDETVAVAGIPAAVLRWILLTTFSAACACGRSQEAAQASRGPLASAITAVPNPGTPSATVGAGPGPSASAESPTKVVAERCATAESLGALPLERIKGNTADESAAIVAAQSELKRLLEEPKDYFVSCQTAGDLVILELWHKSAFGGENCALTGNPGEKSRTLTYDPKRRRLLSSKVWR